jgi:DNA-binding transcriptional MerR regulator
MILQLDSESPATRTLQLFQPSPCVLYTLEATAQLAGVSRRSLLIYCRRELVHPIRQLPHGSIAFTAEAIYLVRELEHLRAVHGIDIDSIKSLLNLLEEMESLRSAVRFWRYR